MNKKLFIFEVCGKQKLLTNDEAYDEGWDYPPWVGEWGVISPRTCGKCLIDSTAWWAIICEEKCWEDLSKEHQQTVVRILQEKELENNES